MYKDIPFTCFNVYLYLCSIHESNLFFLRLIQLFLLSNEKNRKKRVTIFYLQRKMEKISFLSYKNYYVSSNTLPKSNVILIIL